VNPDIEGKEHDRLAEEGRKEALACLDVFAAWMKKKEMRNKVQYKVVEVDYRYFKGANYYNEQSSDEVIHVGMLLYFGSKKKAIISADTSSRTFKDIKFFPHDATIVDSWYPMLDELSDYLKENDRKGVLLSGYTDNQGTEEYCVGLSRQRAVEVKKALQMRGIDANRIEVEALGTANPIGDNDTYEGRIQNNRVSIKIQ
jgi:outer membrane protein OmpA-like peptidoglycan-associated protein